MQVTKNIRILMDLMPEHPGVTKEERIELYQIAVANSDIGEALLTTRFFIKNVKDIRDDLWMPLQDTIVISYARPFTSNKPFGPVDSNYVDNLSGNMKKLHLMLINTRNKLIAHSDLSERKVQITPPGVRLALDSEPTSGVGIQLTKSRFTIELFPDIERLCVAIGGKFNKIMLEKVEKYYGSMNNLPSEPFDLIL